MIRELMDSEMEMVAGGRHCGDGDHHCGHGGRNGGNGGSLAAVLGSFNNDVIQAGGNITIEIVAGGSRRA